ncbi:23S rRNA (adenine(2503)-C(2))-methyltransferase RlmN [Chloroflexi bacterium TSY]|nr:23S rRNA (adenine(2503)-C(2))-methyltransferase RlmN [Chloroflexi bacterium TSY]
MYAFQTIIDAPTDNAYPTSLLEFSQDELVEYLAGFGQPKYRAQQIWDWIYKRPVLTFGAMTNLPKELRQQLSENATVAPLAPIQQIVSKERSTKKNLFRLADGKTIESVLMIYDKRRTLCISSQAGCAMGCTFCATAIGGLARNLSAGEIVAQVLYDAHYLANAHISPSMAPVRPTTVTNIVLMGMGEPMHNYRNVWTALRRLTNGTDFGLGARHVTLSTVGLVPMIDRMADESLQVGLAVSLHAPNDELRSQLVPINNRYPIADLMAVVERYIHKTNRRVTFEYALMRGINDSTTLAHDLVKLLSPLLCHVNVIPLNPVPDSPYQPTSETDTQQFVQILKEGNVPATVRVRCGIEINAGCGQLQRFAAILNSRVVPK